MSEGIGTEAAGIDRPVRVQLRRSKGWRMPPNTVKVDRTTKWGNPFNLNHPSHDLTVRAVGCKDSVEGRRKAAVILFRGWIDFGRAEVLEPRLVMESGPDPAVCDYAPALSAPTPPTPGAIRAALRGKNLACWCPPGQPCHADVLLEIANG